MATRTPLRDFIDLSEWRAVDVPSPEVIKHHSAAKATPAPLAPGSAELRSVPRPSTIVTAGQASDALFVLTRGAAMVSIATQDTVARLDVFTPRMTFGEVAFLDRSTLGNVTAVDDVECLVLARDDFDHLDGKAPALKIKLLENLALGLTRLLRHANRALAALQ